MRYLQSSCDIEHKVSGSSAEGCKALTDCRAQLQEGVVGGQVAQAKDLTRNGRHNTLETPNRPPLGFEHRKSPSFCACTNEADPCIPPYGGDPYKCAL